MIDVVCAIMADGGRILIVRHGPSSNHPGRWEFPGGKIDEGEDARQALIREIREELNLEIEPGVLLDSVIYEYDNKAVRLTPFLCLRPAGDLRLNEHADFRWIRPEDAAGFDMLEADRLILGNERILCEIVRFLKNT